MITCPKCCYTFNVVQPQTTVVTQSPSSSSGFVEGMILGELMESSMQNNSTTIINDYGDCNGYDSSSDW